MKTEPLFEGHDRVIDTTESHFIEWVFDRESVTANAVCESGPDANCRLVCPEGCEEWAVERDPVTGVAFHWAQVDSHESESHSLRAEAECGFTPWLNQGDIRESGHEGPTFTIARTPIESVWCGDYAEWSPATPSHQPIEETKA